MLNVKQITLSLILTLLFPLGVYAKEKELVLEEGRIVEATYMKATDNTLLGEYYKKLVPLAKEYGAKPLLDFSIVSVDSGKIRPNFVVLFEFPNSEEMEDFRHDSRFRKIQPMLVRATGGFYVEHVRVEKDMTFTFSDEKIYELYSLWINPEKVKYLNSYFEQVGAEAGKWGAKFPISLKPVCVSSKGLLPSSFGISEWPSEESKDQFLQSEAYTQNVYLRNKALDKMNLFTAKAVIY